MQAIALKCLVYPGKTKQELWKEALRFLTERGMWDEVGGTWSGSRNRPMLVKLVDGVATPITMGEARDQLHAHAVIVHEFLLNTNALRLEACIQVSAAWDCIGPQCAGSKSGEPVWCPPL
jgi:hypothetical protein